MMRIPAAIGLMSATVVFLSTGEPRNDPSMDRNSAMAVAKRVAKAKFVAARNFEINASMATVAARRKWEFVEARNAEIAASMAAVRDERTGRSFAGLRNREIARSMATVEVRRTAEFVAQRNKEIMASLNAVAAQKELVAFAAARNGEINSSIAAVESVRMPEFAAARNAEIRTAMMAYDLQRTSVLAMARRRNEISGLETGSIQTQGVAGAKGNLPAMQTPGGLACQSMIRDLGSLRWSRGSARIDRDGRRRLDMLADIASRCTSLVIEVHGAYDASRKADKRKRLAERRARAVADYLIGSGIEARRVLTTGGKRGSTACGRCTEIIARNAAAGPNLSEVLRSLN